MPPSTPAKIAVVADAHFHDLYGDYGIAGIRDDTWTMALRLLADTARSTRVFNESHSALRFTLDDIARRGISHVVLLGDYSDDGQAATLAGLRRLLDDYTARLGMRFYATVGNHDIFGASGRHRSKRFASDGGGYRLATSDPQADDRQARGTSVTDRMYCHGYPAGLQAIPDIGFFRRPADLHWETPFGANDDPATRLYEVRSPDGQTSRWLMDASYLAEPFPGVWLMMIDANVFEPVDGMPIGRPGDLADSTGAGWNAMLRHKPFILDWARDVSARAERLGKSLLAFSHYPVLDPLDGTQVDELALAGRNSLMSRIPGPDVAEALMDAGLRIHFSGHLHVNDTARAQGENAFLINIATPALVAFPCAYKIVGIAPGRIEIETVDIDSMPLDTAILKQYRLEVAQSGLKTGSLLDAGCYGDFLDAHLAHLVGRRYLRREWPKDLAALLPTISLRDMARLAMTEQAVEPRAAATWLQAQSAAPDRTSAQGYQGLDAASSAAMAGVSAMTVLADWYRLRMGSDLGRQRIPQARHALYAIVADLYERGQWDHDDAVQTRFEILFRTMRTYASGLPSQNFSIDMRTGAISPPSGPAL